MPGDVPSSQMAKFEVERRLSYDFARTRLPLQQALKSLICTLYHLPLAERFSTKEEVRAAEGARAATTFFLQKLMPFFVAATAITIYIEDVIQIMTAYKGTICRRDARL